jgi:BlaI family transcriptional regulator, penicillinase repressor
MEWKAPLSVLERAVMNIVWKRGNATAAEVQRDLAPERPLRDSTIRTVLTRLEDKGYVRHEVSGRTFVYSGLQPAGSVAARAVKQIVDRFCQGSLESLLAGMVDDELVDADELQEIVNRLSRERRKASSREGRKKRK